MDLTELKRQVGFLDEYVRKLEILLEPGYGGTASELVRLLQDQEARDATLASRLAAAEARVAVLEGLLRRLLDKGFDHAVCKTCGAEFCFGKTTKWALKDGELWHVVDGVGCGACSTLRGDIEAALRGKEVQG